MVNYTPCHTSCRRSWSMTELVRSSQRKFFFLVADRQWLTKMVTHILSDLWPIHGSSKLCIQTPFFSTIKGLRKNYRNIRTRLLLKNSTKHHIVHLKQSILYIGLYILYVKPILMTNLWKNSLDPVTLSLAPQSRTWKLSHF
jgi:hypothetical protein